MAVPPDDRGRGCALPQPTTGGTTSHTYLVPEKSLASTLRAPTTSIFSVMVVAEGTPPTKPLPDDRRRALMTKKGAHRQRGVAGELLLARMRSMFYFRETAAWRVFREKDNPRAPAQGLWQQHATRNGNRSDVPTSSAASKAGHLPLPVVISSHPHRRCCVLLNNRPRRQCPLPCPLPKPVSPRPARKQCGRRIEGTLQAVPLCGAIRCASRTWLGILLGSVCPHSQTCTQHAAGVFNAAIALAAMEGSRAGPSTTFGTTTTRQPVQEARSARQSEGAADGLHLVLVAAWMTIYPARAQ